MMVLLELFISFLKIGFTSFGGLSMIPLITSEMTSHGWMTAAEVSDIVAIAEMTPGPLGLNCATFAGMRTAGFLGAIAANLGTLSPTLTVCLLASIFFERFRTSNFMTKVMTGVRPACVGMIFGVIFFPLHDQLCRGFGRNQLARHCHRRCQPAAARAFQGQHSEGDLSERRAGHSAFRRAGFVLTFFTHTMYLYGCYPF